MSWGLRFLAIFVVGAGAVAGGVWAYARGPGEPALPANVQADRIVIAKADRRMTLYAADRPLKTYRISIGRGNPGQKTREGDGRTPEGRYRITGRNPDSVAYLSLRISYPEPQQVLDAAARGVPPGGDIMIHGLMNGYGWIGRLHRLANWTQGCVAVTDTEMDELWRAVPDGTAVEIKA